MGITIAMPGRKTPGEAAHVEQARGEDRTRVPGRDDCIGFPVADSAHGAHERGVRLEAHHLGRLVVHLDHLARDDVREAVRVELGRAEDDGLDALLRGGEGAGDDLLRGMVAPEGVHGDPAAHWLTVREFRAAECRGPGTSCTWGRRDGRASGSRSSGTC